MDEDISARGWPRRALCRWIAYTVLWTITVAVCTVSAFHVSLAVAGALLGCLLASALPLLFATLFEVAYSRRARKDMPLICCPWMGAVVIVVGALVLLQASSMVVSLLSTTTLESTQEFCKRFAGIPQEEMPRTACIANAFVKTDWESGKLECMDHGGHVSCLPAFVAAPVFNNQQAAADGLADEVWAWAVTKGQHVDVNYRPDGSLCGYLTGKPDFDFFLGEYRLAIGHGIEHYHLVLSQAVDDPDMPKENQVSLETRPIIYMADPAEETYKEQAWLLVSLILLCLCPCVGPGPLGAVFIFFCWARHDKYGGRSLVAPDDDDDLGMGFA